MDDRGNDPNVGALPENAKGLASDNPLAGDIRQAKIGLGSVLQQVESLDAGSGAAGQYGFGQRGGAGLSE